MNKKNRKKPLVSVPVCNARRMVLGLLRKWWVWWLLIWNTERREGGDSMMVHLDGLLLLVASHFSSKDQRSVGNFEDQGGIKVCWTSISEPIQHQRNHHLAVANRPTNKRFYVPHLLVHTTYTHLPRNSWQEKWLWYEKSPDGKNFYFVQVKV